MIFALIFLLIGGVFAGGYYILTTVPWFALKSIKIVGNVSVPDNLIQKICTPYMKANILSINKKELKSKISSISRISRVKVKRQLLHTLVLNITERKGCLYLRSLEGDLFPVDSEGIVLDKYSNIYNENLPVLSILINNSALRPGKKLNNSSLARILSVNRYISKQAPEFLPNISEYYIVNNVVYIVDSRNGKRLIPSLKNAEKQFKRYQFVLDNGDIADNSVLDLRFNDQVVVKNGN